MWDIDADRLHKRDESNRDFVRFLSWGRRTLCTARGAPSDWELASRALAVVCSRVETNPQSNGELFASSTHEPDGESGT
jgi:hypothetical protein